MRYKAGRVPKASPSPRSAEQKAQHLNGVFLVPLVSTFSGTITAYSAPDLFTMSKENNLPSEHSVHADTDDTASDSSGLSGLISGLRAGDIPRTNFAPSQKQQDGQPFQMSTGFSPPLRSTLDILTRHHSKHNADILSSHSRKTH